MRTRVLRTIPLRAIGLLAAALLLGCSSSDETPAEAPVPAPATSPTIAPTGDVREEMGRLRNDVQSLGEKLRTLERNIEVLLRGRRSGLYENESDTGAIDLPKDLPSRLTEAHEAPAGRTLAPQPAREPSGASPAPREAIADAELKMQRGQYGEAVVLLSELRKTTPDLDDDGHSLVLLADCWNHLRQYENAVQALRTFYLRFPKSEEFLKGKLLEAAAYEGMGSRERALGLYREVVALGPKTGHAQSARSAMQRLRDER